MIIIIIQIKYFSFIETLRKYPPGPLILRKSITNYTFNNTKISIPEESFVWIPLYAIHHDPKIYPNPDAFIPERFNDDAIATRHPMHYLPFGDGPRNCIGIFIYNFFLYLKNSSLKKDCDKNFNFINKK